MIHVCTKAKEWREAVGERDGYRCSARTHASDCDGSFGEAHHIVYKRHLTPRSSWIVENGIALSSMCHRLAHATHNGNLASSAIREATSAVNFIDDIKIRAEKYLARSPKPKVKIQEPA